MVAIYSRDAGRGRKVGVVAPRLVRVRLARVVGCG
jgi:hypothetical protein